MNSLPIPSRKPSLALVIDNKVASALLDLHTHLPGRVEAVNAVAHTVDVQPMVKALRVGEDGVAVAESLPVLSSVPLAFEAGGGMSITVPVVKGDMVWLEFAEGAIDQFLANGAELEPSSGRRHWLADAVARPVALGPATRDALDTSAIVLGRTGSPADFVALAAKVDTALGALKTLFSGWTPVPGDGGAVLKTAATALIATGWPVTVASTSVKVKG